MTGTKFTPYLSVGDPVRINVGKYRNKTGSVTDIPPCSCEDECVIWVVLDSDESKEAVLFPLNWVEYLDSPNFFFKEI